LPLSPLQEAKDNAIANIIVSAGFI